MLNLSVLDGWWAEGYNGKNGWAITPHGPNSDSGLRDYEEAKELLDILEYQVIPLYFERDHQGYSPGWVQYSKASMKSLIPHYSAQRMFMDYAQNFYRAARDQYERLSQDHASPAKELARWKGKVRDLWPGVSMQLTHHIPTEIKYDEVLPIKVSVFLNGLSHEDVIVECLLGCEDEDEEDGFKLHKKYGLEPEQNIAMDTQVNFSLNLKSDGSGLQCYKIRMYPHNTLLSHPFETGFMIWL